MKHLNATLLRYRACHYNPNYLEVLNTGWVEMVALRLAVPGMK